MKVLCHRNNEKWKPVKGFTSYLISNFGNIISSYRGAAASKPPIKRKLQPDQYGYLRIILCSTKNLTNFQVHILVIKHFGPPKPSPNHQCNHIDTDKTNNWWTNLEWVTGQENMDHAVKNGLIPRGESVPTSKLTEKDVREIRKLYKTKKYSERKLATDFLVTQPTINKLLTYKTWKHVKENL